MSGYGSTSGTTGNIALSDSPAFGADTHCVASWIYRPLGDEDDFDSVSLGDAELDGEDVTEIFHGNSYTRKQPLTWEIRFPVYGRVNDMSPRLALRHEEWKFLMNPNLNRVELYNIEEDPGEVDNLAGENPGRVEKFTKYLLDWHETLPEGPVHQDAGEKVYSWPSSGGD